MEIDTVTLEAGATALDSDVIAMYRMGADIVNSTIAGVLALCKPGALVTQLCQFGDVRMHEQVRRGQGKHPSKGHAPLTTATWLIMCSWRPCSTTGRSRRAWRSRQPCVVGWAVCVVPSVFRAAHQRPPVNACVENYSPMPDDATILVAGDLAKVTLGVQIDGHVVMGTQSVFVGALGGPPVESCYVEY